MYIFLVSSGLITALRMLFQQMDIFCIPVSNELISKLDNGYFDNRLITINCFNLSFYLLQIFVSTRASVF